MNKFCKLSGFSLIELLIVLAIVGVIASIGIPLTGEMLANQRLQMAELHLQHLIQFARDSAINQESTIIICPSSDKLQCSHDWNQPIMIFLAPEGATERDHDAPLLRMSDPITQGKLTWAGFPQSLTLSFNPDGFSANQNGTFQYCLNHEGWKLVINRLGRIRKEKTAC
jgi:type IV fimbrial biogenesis protein FimT